MLDGVHATIRCFNRLIKRNKACLERCKFDEKLNRFAIVLFELCNIRAAFAETRQIVCIRTVAVRLENRQKDAYNEYVCK